MTSDFDNDDRFHPFKVPATEETCRDRSKDVLCNVRGDSFSFLRRLPVASSFLLTLTTLLSVTSAYLGIELVLNRASSGEFP
jgi:hypothetical protein